MPVSDRNLWYRPLPPPTATRSRRRWPGIVVAFVIGVVVAIVVAQVGAAALRHTSEPEPRPTATVTVVPPEPVPPPPLPTELADRQTCVEGWLAARDLRQSAIDMLDVMPKGIRLDNPAIQQNPDWVAAVRRSADAMRQAGDALETHIALGATPLLASAARTAVTAFHTEAFAYTNFAPAMWGASALGDETSQQIAALCTRLVPEG